MILAGGLSRGLRMQDTESMTLGMWIDYVIEYNNMQRKADKKYRESHDEKTGKKVVNRRATQSDFDRF